MAALNANDFCMSGEKAEHRSIKQRRKMEKLKISSAFRCRGAKKEREIELINAKARPTDRVVKPTKICFHTRLDTPPSARRNT